MVGPNFSEAFLPAYPANPQSRLDSRFFDGREVEQLNLEEAEKEGRLARIAGFDAVDYFGDGSFYLLSAPGHLIGHICGLARTTPDTFIFMGGDVAHFPGVHRPTYLAPLPDILPKSANLDVQHYTLPCPCSAMSHLRTITEDSRHQFKPFYDISRSEHSAYTDRDQAVLDVEKLQQLDANPNVLVCLAHDSGLLDVLPVLNHNPNQDLNHWKAKGWKEQIFWRFLSELPLPGGLRAKPQHVNGIWKNT